MIPSELLAKFFPNLRDAISYSLTSKQLYNQIHSGEFFNAYVYAMQPDHPYFRSEQERKEGLLQHRFLDLRGHFLCKTERVFLPLDFGKSNEDYYVISEGSSVLVYTADKKTALATYEMNGEICQVHLQGHKLFIVEKDVDDVCYLITYNLQQLQETATHTILHGAYTSPLCFGKDHFIYVEYLDEKDTAYVIPYAAPNVWTRIIKSKGILYFFSHGTDIMEARFERMYLSLSVMSREESLIKNLKLPFEDSTIQDVHFHNNRLFFACEISGQLSTLFCYDFELRRLIELATVPQGDDPCFLSTAEKIYFLGTRFTTLTFGKL